MKGRRGAAAGQGNARQAWDEFKPYKRENKRTRARDASRVSSDGDDGDDSESDGYAVYCRVLGGLTLGFSCLGFMD